MQDQFDPDPDEEYYKDDEDHYLWNYNDGIEASETGEDPYYDLPPEIRQNERLIEEPPPPMRLNPQELHGDWGAGYALDFYGLFQPFTYTQIGNLVYQVKYKQDRDAIQPLAEIAAKFVKEDFAVNGDPVLPGISAIIPIPPSNTTRSFQPVCEIAAKVGKTLNLSVPTNYLIKVRETQRMFRMPIERRRENIRGAFAVRSQDLKGRCALLFDDVYQTGTTLTEATNVLRRQGGVWRVLVLTLTRTYIPPPVKK